MASVLDEILEWSATRPSWQRDALRRIVTFGQVDEEAIGAYAAACMGEEPQGLEPLSPNLVRANGDEQRPVAVLGVREAMNVNALADGEVQTFAPAGLTIVYGDNASGKKPGLHPAWFRSDPIYTQPGSGACKTAASR